MCDRVSHVTSAFLVYDSSCAARWCSAWLSDARTSDRSSELLSQLLIALAPGVAEERGKLGTPIVMSGLVLAAAGTVVFPAILAYLSNQVRLTTIPIAWASPVALADP